MNKKHIILYNFFHSLKNIYICICKLKYNWKHWFVWFVCLSSINFHKCFRRLIFSRIIYLCLKVCIIYYIVAVPHTVKMRRLVYLSRKIIGWNARKTRAYCGNSILNSILGHERTQYLFDSFPYPRDVCCIRRIFLFVYLFVRGILYPSHAQANIEKSSENPLTFAWANLNIEKCIRSNAIRYTIYMTRKCADHLSNFVDLYACAC